jgi:hypothetical protein
LQTQAIAINHEDALAPQLRLAIEAIEGERQASAVFTLVAIGLMLADIVILAALLAGS